MKQTQIKIVFLAVIALFAAFVILVVSPAEQALATTAEFQSPRECAECHSQANGLWEESRHRESNVSCVVCHKLDQTGGEHPETAKYTVESEETTCLVCHAEVAGEDIAGQIQISKHGQVGLTCISCHEQHSQGLKLAQGSRTVCENCHKKEMEAMLTSTHFAAGLSCVNCHMGEDKNHTLIVAVQTCDECHTNLHEANSLLNAGISIRVMDKPEAMVEITPTEHPPQEEETAPVSGGVNMPPWTLVFAGIIIGAVLSWALVGKDPGKPSDE